MIEGDIQDLKNIFRYASLTNCVLVYFHLKGEVFLLYRGGHYVYLQTRCIVSNNVAIPTISCKNIERFINAEERRAQRDHREIYTLRIEKEHLITWADIQVSHKYKIPMFKDTFFSPTAERLKQLVEFKDLSAPSIRIKKKVFLDFLKVSSMKKDTYICIYTKDGLLHFRRMHIDGAIKKQVEFESGFVAIQKSNEINFVLNDDALYLLKGIRDISKDDFVYLSLTKDYVQLEYDGIPGRFRFFLPFQNKIDMVYAL